MFIRKKINKSGSTSVQIIEKSNRKNTLIKTIGCSSEKEEIEFFIQKANNQILKLMAQPTLPFYRKEELAFVDSFIQSIDSFKLVGPELLLGKIFDEIGFNIVKDKLFRHLVITRLVYPVSKLKTVDYLFKYLGVETSVYSIYRYLDKLHAKQINLVKEISLKHTLSLFENKLSVVFYDVTTLYFEASDEDDLRKTGFSKDGKHQCPQIVLGLLVSAGGYPLDYDIFEGTKYEGDTMMEVVDHFTEKYKLEQLIIVADSGLLSKKNIKKIEEKKYQYILGARLKNETEKIQQIILSKLLRDTESTVIMREDGHRLILSYKENRAKKDSHNRKKGLEKLKQKIASGKLTKANINNKGYNKYLRIEGDTKVSIDEEKFIEDMKWDGLKGYRTNTSLTKEEVINQYNQLWMIEQTFRISKSDLQIRPIYHQIRRRIEAHICISFIACKIYKELERQLKLKGRKESAEKVIEILKTIYEVTVQVPHSNNVYKRLLIKTNEQRWVAEIFNLENQLG